MWITDPTVTKEQSRDGSAHLESTELSPALKCLDPGQDQDYDVCGDSAAPRKQEHW